MQMAAEAMAPSADKLKGLQWKDALPLEQKALQSLLRAEATFRQIQVAFGQQRGGGGGRGGGRVGGGVGGGAARAVPSPASSTWSSTQRRISTRQHSRARPPSSTK